MRFTRLGGRLGTVGLAIGSTLLLLASAGCGGESGHESTAGEEASGAATGAAGGAPTISLPEKKSVRVDADTAFGQLPEGFPDDLLLPPDTEAKESISIPGQFGMVHFLAKGSQQEVTAYFTENLPGQGWKVDEKVDKDKTTLIRASKGERKADIVIEKPDSGSGTDISITVGGA